MRCVAYGVLDRTCFIRKRVTPKSAQCDFSFSTIDNCFEVLSSASDSRSLEMPFCRISTKACSKTS